MKARFCIPTLMAVAVTIVIACGDDSPVTPPKVLPIPDGTTRMSVLSGIEYAYNKRRIDRYDAVLDPNFTFYFAPGDVGGGIPQSWGRLEEVMVNTRLFDINYSALPCQSVFMDIRTEEGVAWNEFNPESAPDETWYSATLYYDFRFDIAPNTYIPDQGSQAVFTVRNAGTEQAPHWQLVEMRDLGGSSIVHATAAATEPTTLGKVKSLYR